MNISLYRMFSEDRWVGIYKYSSRLSILRSILRSIVQQQTYKLVSDGVSDGVASCKQPY